MGSRSNCELFPAVGKLNVVWWQAYMASYNFYTSVTTPCKETNALIAMKQISTYHLLFYLLCLRNFASFFSEIGHSNNNEPGEKHQAELSRQNKLGTGCDCCLQTIVIRDILRRCILQIHTETEHHYMQPSSLINI